MRITHSTKVEDQLLATHITDNADFENACQSNNAEKIMAIVNSEMKKHNLYTKGALKLRDEIFGLLRSRKSYADILFFVWNSRMSGTGFAVIA